MLTVNRIYYFSRSFDMGFQIYGLQKKNGNIIRGGGEKNQLDMIRWDIPTTTTYTGGLL